MISAPVPGVVNALQVTIPGRLPSVPSVEALGNAREEEKKMEKKWIPYNQLPVLFIHCFYTRSIAKSTNMHTPGWFAWVEVSHSYLDITGV